MANTYQIESESFYPGDKWSWTEEITDYPASGGYTLTLLLRQGDTTKTIAATADGDDYSFSVDTADTTAFTGGYAEWRYRVSDGGDLLKTIASGGINIASNISTEQSELSFWQARYDEAKSLYEKLCARSVMEVSINGRSIKYADRAELTAIMAEAKRKIDALSGNRITKIKTRFARV